ncbi:MAG TPA: tetratricopeptide repeat protein [Stellaceae bacterium]|nr:tetratricopeptide repeat protein [Stellaceae bacterium]
MFYDARGVAVTATHREAVSLLDAVLSSYAAFKNDTGDRLKAALAADPALPMAPVLRGYFLLLLEKRELVPRALDAANTADAAMEKFGATERERRHSRALRLWAERDLQGARAVLASILEHEPRDLLALKLAQYLYFYAGDWRAMRATIETALAAWDESVPGYGYVLGCHAFGLEECGAYGEAEKAGRRAVELCPDDIWAGHAVAHCCEMEDRTEDGLAWLDAASGGWKSANNFAFHLAWHRCLFLLALKRYDEALALYDRAVRPESTDDLLDISNGVSLLWRLEQLGIDVGPRWEELAARSAKRSDDHMQIFGDAHYAMALAAAGGPEGFARWRRSSANYAAGSESGSAIMSAVGLALGDAAAAHRSGDYARATELLFPLRESFRRIGGSHAQRDLFAKLLIDSAVKAGRVEVARDLLNERLAARPRNAWAQAMAAAL